MIEVLGQLWDSVLGIRLDGEGLTSDPEQLIPLLNKLIEENDCDRCVIEMHDLDSAAYYPFWEDLSSKEAQTGSVRRCAIVSEDWAQKWSRKLITPLFPSAQVEWFEKSTLSAAWKWATQNEEGEECEETKQADAALDEPEMIGLA